MTDYIGPFGPEQVEILARAMCDAADESHGLPPVWETRGDSTREMWRQNARWAISAAVSALDREALIEKVAAALQKHGQTGWTWCLSEAEAVIAAIFPTEGETER